MKELKFSYFLGIDQTGAATHQGKKAKPLKCCLVNLDRNPWEVHTQIDHKPLSLASLDRANLQWLLKPFNIAWPTSKLAILADCVFGLPHKVVEEITTPNTLNFPWELFQRAQLHTLGDSLYGRAVSESFFANLLPKSSAIPKRFCEQLSGSNSVFVTRPYQKNIQTGTYRIWRDLACSDSKPWLNIWPFNSKDNFQPDFPWIFEGYPSLLWRELFDIPTRNSSLLLKKLKAPSFRRLFCFDSYRFLNTDPDLCDAVVLALAGAILQKEKALFTPFPGFWSSPHLNSEGWICGLKPT